MVRNRNNLVNDFSVRRYSDGPSPTSSINLGMSLLELKSINYPLLWLMGQYSL